MPALQIYGLAWRAPTGSDAMAIFCSGDRSNGVIIATGNQQFRLRNLKAGEIALTTTPAQSSSSPLAARLRLHAPGSVAVTAPSVTIADKDGGNATVAITGNLTATGEDYRQGRRRGLRQPFPVM